MPRTAKRLSKLDFPTVANEPALADWLGRRSAELLWHHDSTRLRSGIPIYRVACYRIRGQSVLITIRSHGLGWEIFTASTSTDPDRVFADAESRLYKGEDSWNSPQNSVN